ncbi:replication protein RepA [Roseomonas vastitatis]|uniref:Replication protein RepA n=2 Tax=Teichococcus vastitatis TaxID=2307076 RepID=A0ABS9W8J7_9PROT|nr:replication protein RepA [Pseudoroseomonas vastitatis]
MESPPQAFGARCITHPKLKRGPNSYTLWAGSSFRMGNSARQQAKGLVRNSVTTGVVEVARSLDKQFSLSFASRADAREQAERIPKKAVRTKTLNEIDRLHELRSSLPSVEDLTFHHSGLCQTSLPHSRPASNSMVWKRQSGRFTLLIRPGVMANGAALSLPRGKTVPEKGEQDYVGVPFGSKARLIMFHLQTEGLKSRTVNLGRNLSAFLRTLGLEPRGGPRGNIAATKEQALRISRCTFTMEWTEDGNRHLIVDRSIVEGMELQNINSDDWSGEVQLSQQFHEHLRDHAVPLDRRGIALLSDSAMALDLYALFAYRLPRADRPVRLSWDQLQA